MNQNSRLRGFKKSSVSKFCSVEVLGQQSTKNRMLKRNHDITIGVKVEVEKLSSG